MIQNEDDIQITKKEIYNTVFDYELPMGWHFEAFGTNYGRHIYGEDILTNHYIVKKDENKSKEDLH